MNTAPSDCHFFQSNFYCLKVKNLSRPRVTHPSLPADVYPLFLWLPHKSHLISFLISKMGPNEFKKNYKNTDLTFELITGPHKIPTPHLLIIRPGCTLDMYTSVWIYFRQSAGGKWLRLSTLLPASLETIAIAYIMRHLNLSTDDHTSEFVCFHSSTSSPFIFETMSVPRARVRRLPYEWSSSTHPWTLPLQAATQAIFMSSSTHSPQSSCPCPHISFLPLLFRPRPDHPHLRLTTSATLWTPGRLYKSTLFQWHSTHPSHHHTLYSIQTMQIFSLHCPFISPISNALWTRALYILPCTTDCRNGR